MSENELNFFSTLNFKTQHTTVMNDFDYLWKTITEINHRYLSRLKEHQNFCIRINNDIQVIKSKKARARAKAEENMKLLQNQINEIKHMFFSHWKINFDDYDSITESVFCSVQDLSAMLTDIDKNVILGRAKRKKDCVNIAKRALNFLYESLQYNSNQIEEFDKEKTDPKIIELQQQLADRETQFKKQQELIINELKSKFEDYKHNNFFENYQNFLNYTCGNKRLIESAEPITEINGNIVLGFKKIEILVADIVYETFRDVIGFPDMIRGYEKNIANDYISYSGYVIETFEPVVASLSDNSNKTYVVTPSKNETIIGIQAFLLKLLNNSPLYSYDFVFIDPISNGSSFNEINGLVNNQGYGITNNIYCDKIEIQKILSELSNKIKNINLMLQGYSSIHEYNNHHEDKIKPTILVAYNMCDEYYHVDLLKPILENAEKCGITVFAIYADTAINSADKVSEALKNYSHQAIDMRQSTYNGQPFEFCRAPENTSEWIEAYTQTLKIGIQIQNDYNDIKDKLPDFYSLDSTHGLHIPFAVNEKNQIVDFHIATPMCYHAFISGETGIGKSVLLHSLVSGVVRCYHPDDVELWLVDYNAVEFAEYTVNTPPHIKLIGLDRSKEFTKSLLDKIFETMEERKRIIMAAGLKNITEYKLKYGKNSMSRVFLIIDESHVLSQHIYEEETYRNVFENILSEYRKFGLAVILGDQAFENSMKGLTPKGKNQIGVRLAMKNSLEEIQATIEIDSSLYQQTDAKNKINTLSTGEIIYRWYEKSDTGGSVLHLDKIKGIYSETPEHTEITKTAIALANETGYTHKNPWIVIGKNRASVFEAKNPFENMEFIDNNPKTFNIILGTPSSLEPYHKIEVRRRKTSNFIALSKNEDIQLSISYFMALNMRKQLDAKIYIFASENLLDANIKEFFIETFGTNVVIAEDMQGYNDCLDEIKNSNQASFSIWYGIDEILDDMEMLAAMPQNNAPTPRQTRVENKFDAIMSRFSDLTTESNNTSFETPQTFYNRSQDIIEHLDKGAAFSKYSLIVVDVMKNIVRKRSIPFYSFEHKLAHNISTDEQYTLFGGRTISIESDLVESSVIYGDGTEYTVVRPYKMVDEYKNTFKEGM